MGGRATLECVADLIRNIQWAIEIKRSMAPKPERGFYLAREDLRPSARFVVYPGLEQFSLGPNLTAISLPDLVKELKVRFAQ